MQVATPRTASEFRGGIIGVTLRPVSGADFASLITDEHLLQSVCASSRSLSSHELVCILLTRWLRFNARRAGGGAL